jgi:hypothetical protein
MIGVVSLGIVVAPALRDAGAANLSGICSEFRALAIEQASVRSHQNHERVDRA